MAYNPTTWGSNDVITKDRLNKIEQGINTASKLSGTDIDADKNWGGKSITNVGAIDVLTGNIGARSQFVDVPGNGATRKTASMSTTLNDGVWTNLLTVTVPTSYSATEASNARFRVNISGAPTSMTPSLTGRVMRGGVEIGIATATHPGYWGVIDGVTVNTTGGFRGGDVLVIAARWNSNGSNYTSVTATSVSITSDRSTEISAKKEFILAGAW